MSRFEVDPETRAKLLEIQKQNGNNLCVDCNAPSPQWASPKFGIFMCLNCSGTHRGLGVHISFIRSVTMDGFKPPEIARMSLGGNAPWQKFFTSHSENQLQGKTFDGATIKERYDSEVGEEWKARLDASVKGVEYVPGQKVEGGLASAGGSRSQTPASKTREAAQEMSTTPRRTGSPAVGGMKAQNEAYFARMGEANASRPEDLHPSQGGKFSGFGSAPPPSSGGSEQDWLADFGKDPMAGLTKGFGWLGKGARTGYEGWVKPNVQKFAESDFTKQAQQQAAQFGKDFQTTTTRAGDTFSRFVEGGGANGPTSPGPEPDKKDFWESFGEPPKGPPKDKEDFWESFGDAPRGPPKEKQDFWESFGEAPRGPPKEKQDFWDSFADAGASRGRSGTGAGSGASIGTSAMKKKEDDWDGW